MQFRGPVPADLYHRYVEFRPFVAGMFTSHTIRGRLLNRALHHQHARVYNYDKTTKYGSFAEPCQAMTKQFLDFVHYDEGGRIFTYVLTLDGQLRFTETGKEFGIDLLSKHTMHSDVSIYIAFSGEFFVRRIKHAKTHKKDSSVDPATELHLPSTPSPDEGAGCTVEEHAAKTSGGHNQNQDQGQEPQNAEISSPLQHHKEKEQQKDQPSEHAKHEEHDTDPSHYELIIDNDSGTYRPTAQKLPLLHQYLIANLPGLKVRCLDCQADEDLQKSLKKEQTERKKAASGGKNVMYLQNGNMSVSSSDEEAVVARMNADDDATGGVHGGAEKGKASSPVQDHDAPGPNGADGNMTEKAQV